MMAQNHAENARKVIDAACRDGDMVVLIVPRDVAMSLFATPAVQAESVQVDYTVREYQKRFEPRLGLNRLREMCAEGAFPDSRAADDSIVPGAYKLASGQWRITSEGIEARRREARALSLRLRRTRAESLAGIQVPGARGAAPPTAPPPASKSPRPREGHWRSHRPRSPLS
jgi:hypothetical protein